MSYDEQRISNLIDGGIEQMKILNTASKLATEAVKNFASVIMKNKRIQRLARIQKKADDLTTVFCEFLFEEGFICDGCSLRPDTCEGSNCGHQMDDFFNTHGKSELGKLYFKIYGDRWNNLSMRIKNELKKQ